MDTPEVLDMDTPEALDMGTPEALDMGTPEALDMGTPEVLDMDTPEVWIWVRQKTGYGYARSLPGHAMSVHIPAQKSLSAYIICRQAFVLETTILKPVLP
jgi:hypothetical protein